MHTLELNSHVLHSVLIRLHVLLAVYSCKPGQADKYALNDRISV